MNNLSDELVNHIIQFLDPHEAVQAALVSTQFLQCVEHVAKAAVDEIATKNLDEDYWIRVRQHANAHYHDQRRPVSLSMLRTPSPPPPERLLLKAARSVPTKQMRIPDGFTGYYSPHALIPTNGNIAFFSTRDKLIRIFDPITFQFYCHEERQDEWQFGRTGETLVYSNGYLVLKSNMFDVFVWELEYDDDTQQQIRAVHFRHRIRAMDTERQWEVNVAENGKIYFLLLHDFLRQQRHQQIKEYDIATGQFLRNIRCHHIPSRRYVMVNGTHHQFLFASDGMHELDLENDPLRTSYQRFGSEAEERENQLIVRLVGSYAQPNGFLLYEDLTDNSFRVVSIAADSGILRYQEALLPPGERDHSKSHIASTTRIFLNDLHAEEEHVGNIMKIDEFDFTTGKKLRTLSTGFTLTYNVYEDDGWWCDVFSNDTSIFCYFNDGDSFIQSFLV